MCAFNCDGRCATLSGRVGSWQAVVSIFERIIWSEQYNGDISLLFFYFVFSFRGNLCQIFSPEPTNTKGVLPHFNDSREEGPVEDGASLKGWLEGLLLSPESVMVRKMRVRNTQDTHEKCAEHAL